MAVICRSFILAFLFVYYLHLFLKAHFVNNSLHLPGVEGLGRSWVHPHRHAWEIIVGGHEVGEIMGVHRQNPASLTK